jgi:hypothetical protein
MTTLSYEEAKEHFIEIDGQLYKKVGCANPDGYINVGFKRKYYAAHRLVFLLNHGFLPEVVDHIDGDPTNNKISNLRAATKSTNALNRGPRVDNKLGIKNVCWSKLRKKWVVNININKKKTQIGYFEDLELAELVAIEARNKYHGEFAKH